MFKIATLYAWAMVGTPYKLGANSTNQGGIDCSAFVLELMRSVGLWGLKDVTAQELHNTLAADTKSWISKSLPNLPEEGNILFFGKSKNEITHTSYALSPTHHMEAGGSDKNGMVRPRTLYWRKDLVAILSYKN